MRPVVLAAFLSGATLFAPFASAEGLYFGGGVGYTGATSTAQFSANNASEFDSGIATLILGQRFTAGAGFWGWETSADFSFGDEPEFNNFTCDEGAGGPYICAHTATLRLVGTYGQPIATGTNMFGSLGVGMALGDYASDFDVLESAYTYGLTVGVGIEHSYQSGLIARGEVIYDDFTSDTQEAYNSDYRATTVRLAVLRKF